MVFVKDGQDEVGRYILETARIPNSNFLSLMGSDALHLAGHGFWQGGDSITLWNSCCVGWDLSNTSDYVRFVLTIS